MDGNRTHPGRLNSAPQTVLKTAEDTSPRSSPTSETPILAVIPTNLGVTGNYARRPALDNTATVLKTALLTSAAVRRGPPQIEIESLDSADFADGCQCPT